MASRKKPPIATEADEADENSPASKAKLDKRKLLIELRDRYKKCVEADQHNRDAYREDMKFVYVPGEQWDQQTKKERGKDRPMYEFNELRIKIKNTINNIRANRPSAKIRGTEDGDTDLAEVMQGLTLNIWNNSDADSITDYAAEHQVSGGMGAWRIITEYCEDSVSDQDIEIEAIRNPLCLYADHSCQDQMKSDANYWILHTRISREAYKAKYPKAEVVTFEPDDKIETDLSDDDGVWIAEYWKKVPIKRNLALLSNGETIDKDTVKEFPEGVAIVKERTVDSHKIIQYICSGDAILEGPNDWAGKEFPFVMVFGEYMVVDGKVHWYGLARHGKDAQRAHNWAMTSTFESIAAAPQAKYWATPEQAKGNATQWAEANNKNLPVMLYNADPKAPGPPPRVGGADIPAALIQASGMSSDALKNVTGIFDASLGDRSNETSGIAIRARQNQGAMAVYNFGDNISKGVRRTYEILLDIIPKVIDTPRSLRILGKDGSEKYVKVNAIDPVTGEAINDLSRGKFDVVVTQGPSFATQRQEAAETYMGMVQSDPQLMPIAGDLIFGALDLPHAEAIAERLKAMLPPQIQAVLSQGKAVPPEAQAVMAQAQQAMQQVQQQGQLVQAASQELDQKGADLTKQEAALTKQIADLSVRQAKFDADVASKLASITMAEAQLIQKECAAGADQAGIESQNDRAALQTEVQNAVSDIKGMAAQFMQDAQAAMLQIQTQNPPQVLIPNRPRVVKIQRVNGEMVPIYEDQVQGR